MDLDILKLHWTPLCLGGLVCLIHTGEGVRRFCPCIPLGSHVTGKPFINHQGYPAPFPLPVMEPDGIQIGRSMFHQAPPTPVIPIGQHGDDGGSCCITVLLMCSASLPHEAEDQ